jgi:hypothetical protein
MRTAIVALASSSARATLERTLPSWTPIVCDELERQNVVDEELGAPSALEQSLGTSSTPEAPHVQGF